MVFIIPLATRSGLWHGIRPCQKIKSGSKQIITLPGSVTPVPRPGSQHPRHLPETNLELPHRNAPGRSPASVSAPAHGRKCEFVLLSGRRESGIWFENEPSAARGPEQSSVNCTPETTETSQNCGGLKFIQEQGVCSLGSRGSLSPGLRYLVTMFSHAFLGAWAEDGSDPSLSPSYKATNSSKRPHPNPL